MYSNENTYDECCCIANDIMFWLIKTGDEFTSEDFCKAARSYKMFPDLIQEFSRSYFKMFEKSGYIKQTDRLSEKDSLPIWVSVEE